MQYNEACRVSLCFSTFQNRLEIHSNTDQPTFLLNRRHSCHFIYFRMNSMKFGFRSRECPTHLEQISYSHITVPWFCAILCRAASIGTAFASSLALPRPLASFPALARVPSPANMAFAISHNGSSHLIYVYRRDYAT